MTISDFNAVVSPFCILDHHAVSNSIVTTLRYYYVREVILQNITNSEVWFLKEGDLIVFEAVEDENHLFISSDGELIVATSEGRFEVHKPYCLRKCNVYRVCLQ